MMNYEIRVLNRNDKNLDAYRKNKNMEVINIMRGSIFGNPFPMQNQTDQERERVIEAFRQHLWKHMKACTRIGHEIERLARYEKTICLVCCCAPKKCHGDVIKAAILWKRKKH